MSTPNIITQIYSGAVKVWDTIVTDVQTDIAKVEAVLPGSAPVIADIKQLASDALGSAVNGLVTYEPALVSGVEGLADAALTKFSGGLALPLVQMTNAGIQKIVADGTAGFQAWALKQQAVLAENNAKAGGG